MGVRIVPELEDRAVPIGQVTGWPNNPRRGDIPTIKESLTEHGQYQTLLVQRSSGWVVKGNNTLIAMRELGAEQVAVQVLDIDDDRARRILAMDNASSDQADYDKRLLAELLAGFEDDLRGTGWDVERLDTLLAGLDEVSAELAALAPPELAQVPDTDAAYAETPEQEQARRDHAAALPPPSKVAAMAEMVLVLEEGDRAEALRMITDARRWLGELRSGEIVLRALRVLAVVGALHDGAEPDADALINATGWTPDTDTEAAGVQP